MKLNGKKIHFIGIGGIGMSAIAHIAAARGAIVSGCDRNDSFILEGLRARGISCWVGHSPEHLKNADLLVRSSAIPNNEPELQHAIAECIPVLPRARMLAKLMEGYQGIGIAGAHGKTTTTWITSNVFMRAGWDPTIMLGGLAGDINGNFRAGRSDLFVTEVDESDRSLLELRLKHAILTNIDREHLDHYLDLNDIKETFRAFLGRMSPKGTLVACTDSTGVADVLDACPGRVVTCGFERSAQVRVVNQTFVPGGSEFDILWHNQLVKDFKLSLPGEHNLQNAIAAVALALECGVSIPAIRSALANTRTVARRFENKGSAGSVTVIDDYGHHPTEIRAMLRTARRTAGGRLVGVFQPHRYSRTAALCKDFADAFDDLDVLVITDIYCAGEHPIEGVSAQSIMQAVAARGRSLRVEYVAELNEVPDRLLPLLQPGDTLITIGAGNVGTLGERMLEKLRT